MLAKDLKLEVPDPVHTMLADKETKEDAVAVVAPKELLCYSLYWKTDSAIDHHHHLQNHDTLRSRLGSASVSYYILLAQCGSG